MGKVNLTPDNNPTPPPPPPPPQPTHFSHPHPLNLISPNPQTLNPSATCAACKLRPSGMVYSCTACGYFLHKKCFDMPKKITHPFHKEHAFTLLTKPAYADGLFLCDACGEAGNGFSYHCKPCGVDLHVLCAAMPLCISHACHVHKLQLAFENPYGLLSYCCDICKNNGSGNWLYRCGSCGFDAHLNCARGAPPPVQPQSNVNYNAFQSQPAATCFGSAPQPGIGTPFMPPPMQQQNFFPNPTMNNAAYGVPVGGQPVPPFEANRDYAMILQTLQQMINNNNAATQAMLAGRTGGFGGGLGGDRSHQQLMQLLSNLSSGGGGGGIPGLNGLGGGGTPGLNGFGGGGDFLQTLMNGGGSGDFLQSLLNGGGGSGGLDFLQNLMGGGGLDFFGGALGGLGS